MGVKSPSDVDVQVGQLVGADPYFNSRRDHIIALAARHRIPAIYEQREHALAGGLMSYGTSLSDGYRQVGIYTELGIGMPRWY
jgi:hypothetical protein